MERIIVEPKEVRALGDIVSPKTVSDFLGWNSSLTSSTDSDYGKVYTGAFLTGSTLEITSDEWVTPSGSSFSVSVTLKKRSDQSAISSATVKCIINEDTVLTGTTNSSGVATFSIPVVSGVCDYHLLFTYAGSGSVGGCFRGCFVRTGSSSDWELSLTGEQSIIQSGDNDVLLATVTGTDCNSETVGVPGQTVYFFEEYAMGVRLSGTSIIQSGDSDVLTAQLYDTEDGSIVREAGHTVYFFKEVDYVVTLTAVADGHDLEISVGCSDNYGPVSGAEVWVVINGDRGLYITTGQDGTGTDVIEDVPNGRYNIVAEYNGEFSDTVNVVVQA